MPHDTRLGLSRNGSTNMNEFSLMQWPAQSSDLNPIEHLWDEMEQAIWSRDPPPAVHGGIIGVNMGQHPCETLSTPCP